MKSNIQKALLECCWSARRRLLSVATVLVVLVSPVAAADDTSTGIAVGVRGGEDALYVSDRSSQGRELFLRVEPRRWRSRRYPLHVAVELGIGRFENKDDEATAVMLGPVLIWQLPLPSLAFEVSSRATWLSEYELGRRDLGGPFQFTSHLGLVWSLGRHLAIGGHFLHISNAGIYRENPGLDLQILEVRYHF